VSGAGRRGFPWAAAMAFGLGVLRLPPEAFWAMTPRELVAAAAGVAGPGAEGLGRAELAALMARYPDGVGGQPAAGSRQ
jgi:uncharacterized phage protein (TIGR02216 family)